MTYEAVQTGPRRFRVRAYDDDGKPAEWVSSAHKTREQALRDAAKQITTRRIET